MILSDKKKEFDITRVKGKAYAEMKDAHYHPYYEFYYLLFTQPQILSFNAKAAHQ